jgi:hypothetical protein
LQEQFAVLFLAHQVDGVVEITRYVELVVHDGRLRGSGRTGPSPLASPPRWTGAKGRVPDTPPPSLGRVQSRSQPSAPPHPSRPTAPARAARFPTNARNGRQSRPRPRFVHGSSPQHGRAAFPFNPTLWVPFMEVMIRRPHHQSHCWESGGDQRHGLRPRLPIRLRE